MILGGSINLCAGKRYGEYPSRTYIVGTAADLKLLSRSGINRAHMKMCLGYGLAGKNLSCHYSAYILTDLIFFLHLESAGKKLFLENIR